MSVVLVSRAPPSADPSVLRPWAVRARRTSRGVYLGPKYHVHNCSALCLRPSVQGRVYVRDPAEPVAKRTTRSDALSQLERRANRGRQKRLKKAPFRLDDDDTYNRDKLKRRAVAGGDTCNGGSETQLPGRLDTEQDSDADYRSNEQSIEENSDTVRAREQRDDEHGDSDAREQRGDQHGGSEPNVPHILGQHCASERNSWSFSHLFVM